MKIILNPYIYGACTFNLHDSQFLLTKFIKKKWCWERSLVRNRFFLSTKLKSFFAAKTKLKMNDEIKYEKE